MQLEAVGCDRAWANEQGGVGGCGDWDALQRHHAAAVDSRIAGYILRRAGLLSLPAIHSLHENMTPNATTVIVRRPRSPGERTHVFDGGVDALACLARGMPAIGGLCGCSEDAGVAKRACDYRELVHRPLLARPTRQAATGSLIMAYQCKRPITGDAPVVADPIRSLPTPSAIAPPPATKLLVL